MSPIIRDINIRYWIPVVIWMGLIFYLSHQVASDSAQLSGKITQIILDFLSKWVSKENLTNLHTIVRKYAHFILYFILAILIIHALEKDGFKRIYMITFIICIVYAISDEIHQIFIEGRAGQIKDVFIDGAGSLFGILLYSLKSFLIK